jgi:hypothetical protein
VLVRSLQRTNNMGRTLAYIPGLKLSIRNFIRPTQFRQIRYFSASIARRTDGVYSELTAMRTRTPFIDAVRKRQEGGGSTVKHEPTEKLERDISPKSMSDSFTRVVNHMIRPPFRHPSLTPVLDITSSKRSMAVRQLYQCIGKYQTGNNLYGFGRTCWCCCVQTYVFLRVTRFLYYSSLWVLW